MKFAPGQFQYLAPYNRVPSYLKIHCGRGIVFLLSWILRLAVSFAPYHRFDSVLDMSLYLRVLTQARNHSKTLVEHRFPEGLGTFWSPRIAQNPLKYSDAWIS